jgi:hypothetical protein
MFHANTQRIIDYWTERAEPGRAPSRAAIDPGDFRGLLPQVFLLGREARGAYTVRLVGGFLGEIHQCELRGANALTLWSEHDRLRLQIALEEIRARPEPLLAMAEVLTDGPSLSLEVLFAPLCAPAGGLDRYLGFYQPLGPVSRLGGRPALELRIRALRRPDGGRQAQAPLRLMTLTGRRVA